MENLAQKVKISALWMFLGIDLTIVYTLKDSYPGNGGLQQMYAGLPPEQLSLLLLGDSAIRLAPFALAVLSLTVNDALSRKGNLVLGFIFTIASFFGLATLISPLTIANAYLLLTQAAGIAATAMVVLYAYRWPKNGS